MLRIIDGVIYMVRGDDESLEVNLQLGGESVDVGEFETLTLSVRALPDVASLPVFVSTSAPGSNRIVINHADTADAAYGEYSADIQLLMADGKRKTVWPVLDEENIPKARNRNLKNFVILPEVTMP